MKKSIVFVSCLAMMAWITLSSRSGGAGANGVGDRTGSPISTGTCSDCHGGGSFTPMAMTVVKDGGGNIVTEYIPGEIYSFEIQVMSGGGAPDYGFQAVALKDDNTGAGSFTSANTPNTQITNIGGIDYAEHAGASSSGMFEVTWMAPTGQPGDITFSAYGLAVDVTGGTGGDNGVPAMDLVLTQACGPATAVNVNNVTGTSAQVSFVGGGAGYDNMSIGASGYTPTTGLGTTSAFEFVEDLTPNTTYDVYVRGNCSQSSPLVISGTFDGPLTNGTPKGIELYAIDDIADLSIFALDKVSNGAGTDGSPDIALPSISLAAGSYYYVANDSTGFRDFFGFNADLISGTMSNNGDDAVEVYWNGSLVDVHGDEANDGTGTAWDYVDGWSYRNNTNTQNGGAFVEGNWTYSGTHQLEGGSTNATCSSPFPLGTYAPVLEVTAWDGPTPFTTLCSSDASLTAANSSCNGTDDGTVAVVDGSWSPYTYDWSNGSTVASQSGLAPGAYQVTTTDANGCTQEFSTTLTEPEALTYTYGISDVSCNGGNDGEVQQSNDAAQLFTYVWSNGQNTGDATGLAAGEHYLTVSDACASQSYTVTIAEPTAISVTSTATSTMCFGDCNGTANFTPAGGTLPYVTTYQWADGNGNDLPQFSGVIGATGLCSDTYFITIMDVNGCIGVGTATVEEPDEIILNQTCTPISLTGSSDGGSSVTASGGASGFTYDWSTGATVTSVTGLPVGAVQVTVSDAIGCSTTSSCTVVDPTICSLSITEASANISCFGEEDGMVSVTITGQQGALTYLWSNGATTSAINGLADATYSVVATDGAMCTITASGTVTEPIEFAADFDVGDGTVCFGDSVGLTVVPFGGTMPYGDPIWSASMGAASGVGPHYPTINEGENSFDVTMTDANGCQSTDTVQFTGFPELAYTVSQGETICEGESVVLCATASGGDSLSVIFTWSLGSVVSDTLTSCLNVTPTGDTVYEVTIDDGCHSFTDSIAITVTPQGTAPCGGASVGELATQSFDVYPVPATDNLMVSDETIINEVRVLDQQGRLVLMKQVNSNQANLDISRLDVGMYYIEISDGKQAKRQKFLKR